VIAALALVLVDRHTGNLLILEIDTTRASWHAREKAANYTPAGPRGLCQLMPFLTLHRAEESASGAARLCRNRLAQQTSARKTPGDVAVH
jgi:hypothetical protein